MEEQAPHITKMSLQQLNKHSLELNKELLQKQSQLIKLQDNLSQEQDIQKRLVINNNIRRLNKELQNITIELNFVEKLKDARERQTKILHDIQTIEEKIVEADEKSDQKQNFETLTNLAFEYWFLDHPMYIPKLNLNQNLNTEQQKQLYFQMVNILKKSVHVKTGAKAQLELKKQFEELSNHMIHDKWYELKQKRELLTDIQKLLTKININLNLESKQKKIDDLFVHLTNLRFLYWLTTIQLSHPISFPAIQLDHLTQTQKDLYNLMMQNSRKYQKASKEQKQQLDTKFARLSHQFNESLYENFDTLMDHPNPEPRANSDEHIVMSRAKDPNTLVTGSLPNTLEAFAHWLKKNNIDHVQPVLFRDLPSTEAAPNAWTEYKGRRVLVVVGTKKSTGENDWQFLINALHKLNEYAKIPFGHMTVVLLNDAKRKGLPYKADLSSELWWGRIFGQEGPRLLKVFVTHESRVPRANSGEQSFGGWLNSYLQDDTLKAILAVAGITLIGSGVLYATTIEGRSYKLNKLYERLMYDIQQFKTKYLTFFAKHRRLGKRIDQLLKAHRKYNPNASSKDVLRFFQRSRALLLDLTQQLIYVQQKGSIRKELQKKYINLTYLDFSQTEHVEEFILILEALMLNIDLNATVPSRLKTMLKGDSWSGKFGFGVGAFASALWWFMNYLKKKRQLQVVQKPKPKLKTKTKRPKRRVNS